MTEREEMGANLRSLLGLFGRPDVAEGDGRTFAHAAEDTAIHVEQVRGRVELGDLTRVEDTYPVVANNRA